MSQSVPIVYLYPGARWGENAGRQHLLPEALSRHGDVVVSSTAEPARSIWSVNRPRAEVVGSHTIVVHDAMSLRANRWWRRLGRLAARIEGAMLHHLCTVPGVLTPSS